MRAHLGVWVKPARQPGAWRVSVTCSVGQPHIPEIFRGKRIVQIAPGRIGLRADHRLAFIRAAGVEWPQQMQEYLKNHHIVVEVGVVCLADVSLSPGWTECFASEVGPRLILRISDIWPLRCLSDRLVRWKILLWDVADAARSLGENVAADLGRAGQGQSGYCFELSWNGVGLVVTLGPVKGQRSNQDPLTPAAVPAGAGERGPLCYVGGMP
ncbi:hypothetical protein PAPYR_12423 [Paratrimastix pyriformis]|uniref:Uncharacterized protein n=1 Tax=Paratrimastix pyriformis TaxID=342808 RepID=A0ABQ8U774_9EUKA|nr:hypothetical protein PAPYR_12423 [Paratrimastix pyriformis]